MSDLARALAVEDLSRFLAACYYEPTPAFAEERLFESMLAAAQIIGPELAESARRLGAAFAAVDLEALLVDYTRLFLGPIHPRAKPYGSFWLCGEATLMQESTMAVLDLYREGGFDLDDAFRELPDHIAAELEFLYALQFKLNAAWRTGDAEHATAVSRLKAKFLAEHLGRWIEPFTNAVVGGAETDFYRELGALTQRFLRQSA